ncbi:hypothetical protein MKW94_003858 [Papaver nudicaule]|uniref:BHLH domain-containing protein n=1 Tax=Papaver nudicaule TaxID=74823 RepID=A0AA41SKB0_PAPNU|nr:hypothetical protein [Papaver nudicaule]
MSSASSTDDNCISNFCKDDDEEFYEQLRTLLFLVPNVTQTDPISILEQTRDYLREIHEQTERLEKEILAQTAQPENLIVKAGPPSSSRDNQRNIASSSTQKCQILKVEIDTMGDKRKFAVNILWKRLGQGAAAEVQRAIEFCHVNIISNSIDVPDFENPDEMQTTAIVKVKKKKRNMKEKELRDLLLTRFPSFSGNQVDSPDMYVCLKDE